VARAKRTDRAEARRRYRAELADQAGADGTVLDDEADAPASRPVRSTDPSRSTRSSGASASAPPPPRSSITGAFRSSFRPVDVRGDLRALPSLLRHPSFLVATILAGLSVAIVPFSVGNPLGLTFYQYFSGTAPLGTAFVAGFFAPRASWLIGGLAALASVGFQALAFSGNFGGVFDNALDAAGNPINIGEVKLSILTQALIAGVPSAIFFASAAAWYRRFLNRANPNRGRPPAGPARRDGKVAKRKTERPILARRR
jgi:hypothetical protein